MQKLILSALNKYCQLDPDFFQKAKVLEGKIIGLHFLKVEKKVFFRLKNQLWEIVDEIPPDVLITGTPLRLLYLALSENPQALFADDVSISGDLEIGQMLLKIFNSLDIEWEEKLSEYIGDTAAFQVGKFTRFLCRSAINIKNTLINNTTDYVQEEKLFTPPKEEINDFFQDIDQLRMDVDRVSAKILLLENKIKQEQK